jgi:preprotein translocase subunit SecG
MSGMSTIIIIVQVLSALAIIGLVLLQHGKGADMGAAFGSGSSGSLFGASGSSNFLSKSTGIAAAIFFAATLALVLVNNQRVPTGGGVMENLPAASASASASASAKASSSAAVASKPADELASAPIAPGKSGQIPK